MTTAPHAPPRPGPAPDWGRPPRRRGSLVGPLILILVGGTLLLQNLGYLSPAVWLELWRLWPLILVLVGLELMLGYRLRGAALALTILALVGAGLFAIGAFDRTTATFESRTFAQALQDANQAVVTVRYGAGSLALGPLGGQGGNQLASMTYDGPAGLSPSARYSVVGGVGRLDYQMSGRTGFWGTPWFNSSSAPRMTVGLSPDVPLSLNLQTGAAQADLDLSGLRVTNLDLSTGAASTEIHLPQNAGMTVVHVSSGAATLVLDVPPGVAAQIRHQGGLSTLNVDQNRFPPASGAAPAPSSRAPAPLAPHSAPGAAGTVYYRSPDYDTAQNKVDITLETGVSTITVR